MAIDYADGAEREVLSLLRAAEDVSSNSLIAWERHGEWPVRYHLSPERANLLRHLDFCGLDVLELGAGMGAASRFLAENAGSFTAVEGSPERLEALKERLRDLGNWTAVLANAQDFQPEARFDAVCLIGVLEYAELYIDAEGGETPALRLLRRAKGLLREGGRLIVAIENRNGLKYWAGAPEDHSGTMYHGICGYGPEPTVRTFSRKVLLELLREAGFGDVEEFYPWPDYKTPSSVVHRSLAERFPFLAADIAADATAHEGLTRGVFFPLTLALREVARSGLFCELANSFLFVCGEGPDSAVKRRLMARTLAGGERAWHYSLGRRRPIATVFKLEDAEGAAPVVGKRPMFHDAADEGAIVRWRPLPDSPALLEETVSMSFRRMAFLNQTDRFLAELVRYVVWVFDGCAMEDGSLRPEAFDLTPVNAVHDGRSFRGFDLEWLCAAEFNKSWFILRCLLVIRDALQLFSRPPFARIGDLYMHLCRATDVEPYLDGDILLEARAQAEIHRNTSFETAQRALRDLFYGPWRPSAYPRDPAKEERIAAASPSPALARRLARALLSPRALRRALANRWRQLFSTL